MTVTDRVTKVEVHLLPGGGSVGPGPMTLPLPSIVTEEPTIADLRTLIEIKLSSYLGSPISRAKDMADVVELIKANETSRDFELDHRVQEAYLSLWNGLKAESSR